MGTLLRRLAVATVVASILALWVFAFFFADSEFSAKLETEGASDRAAGICNQYIARVEALPLATSARDPQERARVLEQANQELAVMVGTLEEAVGLETERDRTLFSRWLGDWGLYLDARTFHAERLSNGEDARFGLPLDDSGKVITAKMDTFADGNNMSRCRTPGDV